MFAFTDEGLVVDHDFLDTLAARGYGEVTAAVATELKSNGITPITVCLESEDIELFCTIEIFDHFRSEDILSCQDRLEVLYA